MARVTRSQWFRQRLRERANSRIRALFEKRVKVFQKNPYDPSLGVHDLKHNLKGLASFRLTDDDGPDDYRVIFKRTKEGYLLVDFGTHDQLYRPWRRRSE